MMLDYELFSATRDIDLELRYSYQHLQSFGGSSASVRGHAEAENLGIYLRRRAPVIPMDAARPTAALCPGGGPYRISR